MRQLMTAALSSTRLRDGFRLRCRMGDAAGVDAGLTFVWGIVGDVTTVVDVEVDVEGLGEVVLPVEELVCGLLRCAPVVRDGATTLL